MADNQTTEQPMEVAPRPFQCSGFAAFMRSGFGPGDEEMVAQKFEAAQAEIERLRGVLTDIANERGHCQTCGRLCDRDSNCTPIDCDRSGKGGCTWAPMDAAAFAKEALAHD